MTAVSKKSRIITRSRYRRTDLLRQGKCRCAAFTDLLCCAPRSPLLRKGESKVRIQFENNCIRQVLELARAVQNPSPLSSLLGQGERRTDRMSRGDVHARAFDMLLFRERKIPPSGWPGQVKALDGVPPQSLDSQRSACVLQAFVVVRSPAALRITHQ